MIRRSILLSSTNRCTTFSMILSALVITHSFWYPKVASADAGLCIERGEYRGSVLLLVDRSDKLKDADPLRQTLLSVKQAVGPGERLIVVTSTGKKSDTRVVFDMIRPQPDVWASALKIRAQEKKFADCFSSTKDALLDQSQEAATSALLETLGFVADIFKAQPDGTKRLVMFSDMIQHSDLLNFYTSKSIDAEASVNKMQKIGMLTTLTNVTVSIAGAGAGVSDEKARAMESFWRKYFEKCGATVKFYGPLLLGL